jgi:NhaA family Na+:H+ antiporter
MNTYQHHFRKRFVHPMQHFIHAEQSSGVVLALSVVAALLLAHSPWSEAYEHFLHQPVGLIFNGTPFFYFSVSHWVNDGLMSLFFFVIGLELKRECIGGELRQIRQVMLPVGAALFGMAVPSLIYLAFNGNTSAASGWGIPMATDIAFALAVVYALGKRLPLSAKLFLTTLAIVDDLGAVLVIAIFYTSQISFASLAIGILFLLVMYGANRLGVKNVFFYGIVGIGGVWTAFLFSGIHATIAAVLAAWMIPAGTHLPEGALVARLRRSIQCFQNVHPNNFSTLKEEQVEILTQIQDNTKQAIPPLQRLEHALHPIVAFVVMPIFAVANAGLSFTDVSMDTIISSNITLGVALGLLLGKPIGVITGVWLFSKFGLGRKPDDMTWKHILGLGFLASIGFTMSIFVSNLAFSESSLILQAKAGIFLASIIGAITGYVLLRKCSMEKKNSM